jgi:hypothetical protein
MGARHPDPHAVTALHDQTATRQHLAAGNGESPPIVFDPELDRPGGVYFGNHWAVDRASRGTSVVGIWNPLGIVKVAVRPPPSCAAQWLEPNRTTAADTGYARESEIEPQRRIRRAWEHRASSPFTDHIGAFRCLDNLLNVASDSDSHGRRDRAFQKGRVNHTQSTGKVR